MAAERNTTSLSGEHNQHGHSGLGLSAAELRGLPGGSVVGYAAGAFDLFHVGHLNILRQAKRHCDYLIAGVVSDEMLELTKGRAPVVPAAPPVVDPLAGTAGQAPANSAAPATSNGAVPLAQ